MGNESKTVAAVKAGGADVPSRERYSADLKKDYIGPLWDIYRAVLTPQPTRREVPYVWPWSVVRPHLVRAGEVITAAEAERRALMLLNPGNPQGFGATATLYAAAQLILPGEIARAHRHSPAALRFIIEGDGAYTSVEGEKIVMHEGDLILTPSMLWHDHGNESDQPVMWLDGLDIPLMDSLRYMFLEEFEDETQPLTKPPQYSEKLYGRALFPSAPRPASGPAPPSTCSPVWAYRWAEAREALESERACAPPDPFLGYQVRYANPANGGETFPTMGCRLQLIPYGTHTLAQRDTTSTVYHVAEGSGFSILDGVRFDWRKGDTFAVPIWTWNEHASLSEDAVLFSFTDHPVMAHLGLLRRQTHQENGGFQKVAQL